MARARIDQIAGLAALAHAAADLAAERTPDRSTVALAVRWSLQQLADRFPGGTVEVRVPPFAVVQCGAGPRHTRGTPPNVIETDGPTWIALATGTLDWSVACSTSVVTASGQRATLAGMLPIVGIGDTGMTSTAEG